MIKSLGVIFTPSSAFIFVNMWTVNQCTRTWITGSNPHEQEVIGPIQEPIGIRKNMVLLS